MSASNPRCAVWIAHGREYLLPITPDSSGGDTATFDIDGWIATRSVGGRFSIRTVKRADGTMREMACGCGPLRCAHVSRGSEFVSGYAHASPVVVVEMSETEAVDIPRSGAIPPALIKRFQRARDKGCNVTTWQDCHARVYGKGSGGGRVAPAPAPAAAFAPIMRACGVEYFPRKLGTLGRSDVESIRLIHDRGGAVMLHGAPGTGKTAALEAAFPDHEYLAGSSDTEVGDLIGGYAPPSAPGEPFVWNHGPMIRAMLRGVAFIIDEVALIDPRVLSFAYAAMDGRRQAYVTANPTIGVVDAVPGFGIHSACNPEAPGANMSEALVSRHIVQIEYPSDFDLCERFCDPKIVNLARNLDARRAAGEITWSPQTRELIGYGNVAKLLGADVANSNLLGCAPPMDHPVIEDALSKVIGKRVNPLRAGE